MNCTPTGSRAAPSEDPTQDTSIALIPYTARTGLDRMGESGHIVVSPWSAAKCRGRSRMYARLIPALMIFAVVPFLNGCSTMSHTGEGALAGGAIGAGTGAILSKATGGNAGPGAVIGGLAGALVGGAVGNEADQREKRALENRAAQATAAGTQLGLADVMQLAKEGQSDQVIINQIRTTRSTFILSAEDLRMLRANDVSDAVVVEMQNHRPEVYPRRHYYGGEPVYIYRPLPPPPPFGVGVVIHN